MPIPQFRLLSTHGHICSSLHACGTGEPGALGRNTSLCKISGHREPVSWLRSLSPWTQQVHDIVKAGERGDTKLQNENRVRLQGPSSNFVEPIKEQRKHFKSLGTLGKQIWGQLDKEC